MVPGGRHSSPSDFIFLPPLQSGCGPEPASLFFPRRGRARRDSGNGLALCQEPDDSQPGTNTHTSQGCPIRLPASHLHLWKALGERREGGVWFGHIPAGLYLSHQASARPISPPPSRSSGPLSPDAQQEETCCANIGLLCLSYRSASVSARGRNRLTRVCV